jgi:hypothetical protein
MNTQSGNLCLQSRSYCSHLLLKLTAAELKAEAVLRLALLRYPMSDHLLPGEHWQTLISSGFASYEPSQRPAASFLHGGLMETWTILILD